MRILRNLLVIAMLLAASNSSLAHTDNDFVFFQDPAVIGQMLIMTSVIFSLFAVSLEGVKVAAKTSKIQRDDLDAAIVSRLSRSNV
jgi:hypothetical protein